MKKTIPNRSYGYIAAILSAVMLTSCAAGGNTVSSLAAVNSSEAQSSGVSSDTVSENSGDTQNGSSDNSGSSSESGKESDVSTVGAPETEKPIMTVQTEKPKTTVQTEKPKTTVQTEKPATTVQTEKPQTDAPAPQWKESAASGTYYAAKECSAREQAVIGSKAVRTIRFGEKLTVTAKTDTGYYKLSDGSFIHSDYLTKTDPAAASKPVTTKAPSATKAPSTTKAPSSTKKPQTVKPSTAAPTSSDLGVPAKNGSTYNSAKAEEKEMFRMINEYRVKNGRSELTWDDNAYRAAQIRVLELIPEWGGHVRPDGSSFESVYDELKVDDLKSMGENLAGGFASVEETFNQWINSEGHRENILKEKFKSTAIAFLSSPKDHYRYYWVQEFTSYFA